VSADRTSRPYAFLVSIAHTHGTDEMLAAVEPVLNWLGTWQYVPHPESSLTYAAARVVENGGQPIHLTIGAAHACYLNPALPNLLLPIWDYPDVPSIDMYRNTRLNWARIADRADLIVAPSKFMAEAFRAAGVTTPAVVLPLPARAGWAELATWGPDLPLTVTVPHLNWGWAPEPTKAGVPCRAVSVTSAEALVEPPGSLSRRLARAGKRRIRLLKPYFSNATIQKLDGYKTQLMPMLRRPSIGGVASFGYRHTLRRWIGEKAHGRLHGFKERLRGRRQNTASPAQGPACLHPSPLTLSGLVYSAVIDYADPTTDDVNLLSAAIHEFRDRPDVTLLIRLHTHPDREAHDLARLAQAYQAPRIEPRCRIVVVAGRPPLETELILGRATSYHVEIGHTRGRALPLIEALASGRPVIAPGHSAYLDWVDEEVGLSIDSNTEPTSWPIDPGVRHMTQWNRLVWSDLRARLAESARIADDHLEYERLSATARQRMSDRASVAVAAETLRSALEEIPMRPAGAYAWD
jgi:glycosyltransferase involved in cell wall biosynthesis